MIVKLGKKKMIDKKSIIIGLIVSMTGITCVTVLCK